MIVCKDFMKSPSCLLTSEGICEVLLSPSPGPHPERDPGWRGSGRRGSRHAHGAVWSDAHRMCGRGNQRSGLQVLDGEFESRWG